ncbi:MAG TPA: MucR family transcriptional regulator [Alphaproteobacteria bacterium]|nr:MucR family transcriptional regulator [Alphaproteobacteria bacterium]
MADTTAHDRLTALTAQVAASYVGNNTVAASEIPQVMATIYQGLAKLGTTSVSDNRPEPAVSPKKSVFPDYIVCLEDGKKLKMLKRHLKTSYNLTPDQYRERWNLPSEYPMVAPNYARQRSRLAKQIGLGTSASRRAPKQKAA